jgi:hypothetical protein
MEKLIEDLISRLEIERTQSFRAIDNLSYGDDKSLEYIHSGKIFAFDFCLNELERLMSYQKNSSEKSNLLQVKSLLASNKLKLL